MPRIHQIERERLVIGPVTANDRIAVQAAAIVEYILGAVEILLSFRFLLLLFGANRGNAFVDLVYSLSSPLVAPFRGIFADIHEGVAMFDWSTLVAMAVYGVLAYMIISLFAVERVPDDL